MAHKLLLADDSLTIQRVVELVLAPENFEIKAVSDGELALEAIDFFAPDIVLADIEMPKLNGYQLCEKIKHGPDGARIPVILLAGAFEPFDEEYARKAGADDYIIKPFESQELISKVKSLLVGFEPAGKTEPEPEDDYEDRVELTGDIHGVPPEKAVLPEEELKWDEDIPVIAEAKADAQEIIDEEYEAKVALSSGMGFEAELAEALREEEPVEKEELQESFDPEAPFIEEVPEIFEQPAGTKISDLMQGDIVPQISSAIKESVAEAIAGSVPLIVENVTRELVQRRLDTLNDEIAAAIRRIVPEVAETIIKKEIEKITSEIK